ncbi:MAG TPA: hypothetical protein QGG32_11360 [Rhodospirillales bacterium]|nr:hypothetical protein [Rhodospirillales bacterium]
MSRSSLMFCVAAVLGSIAVSAAAFPLAALSSAELVLSKTPVEADEMGAVDLGDFGTVSVLELVSYYMENPPALETPGTRKKKVRFQGC